MAELRERLRRALRQSTGPAAGSRALSPPASVGTAGLPSLRQVETRRGPVHLTDERWPLDHRHGSLPLRSALALDETAMARLTPGLAARDLGGAAFIDVETTGLAGGTGTYVFLVGLGTFESGSFRLRQYFLAHLGEETAMLAAISDALAGCRVMVSFNGRRFDLPLLVTRFTLNRLPSLAADLAHVDLLYPSQRLNRQRLSSCRLATLEEALLGVRREDDLPSWTIPGVYFDYVRRGLSGALPSVFRHNAGDVLSLVTLLGHLGMRSRVAVPADRGDLLALARWDETDGRIADAALLYEAALEGSLAEHERAIAHRRLARLYRRLGRLNDQARILRNWLDDSGASGTGLEARVEVAKMEEHRHRDYRAAAVLTEQALALLDVMTLRGDLPNMPSLQRDALEHRLWRLHQRLAHRTRAEGVGGAVKNDHSGRLVSVS